ncbi:5-carboxymethyl-2-hydroxymuconate isomerase [Aquimarina sp. EL_43]|uniref:5-carboxymethyl-2-hydroxymuconate Delta-isomerase n=1 Tax=unclassified Aquimarina TaxID=2627091 RepID=UPI0018C8DF69|nr:MULTISPECIES: hypothetical protein [unclassified Aquimarina]MBG6132449.1 5-carboxymethyl-2-hydroxymuconate isomerase [Aquimarina sp. EL_35]MBG6152580.1 5-carboxymethyl-2-hydroxymuconate isomerase [Aquimarina sp. EL_32]MBG6170493.1 5-carboxymethyl-2-hydroxymuconate isomerase [Aquimarina sp. EL_43]
MPHITLECSGNIEADFRTVFQTLTDELVATGHIPRLGVKCRVVQSSDHFIIDGNPDYKMMNLLIRLREGRSLEVRKELSEIGMKVLQKYFQKEINAKEIILSTEIKELIMGLDLTKNAVR